MASSKENELCECEIVHEEALHAALHSLRSDEDYLRLSELFKIFGDPTRVKMLHALEHSELCGCDLAAMLGVTKSAVSHQLKTLRLARLVKSRREGQSVYYSLADDHVKLILDMGFEHLFE